MSNMRIWEQVDKTDPAFTNKVTYGRKFTAIDPHYQIMNATKVFGPFGMGWGIKDSKFNLFMVDPTDAHYNLLQYTGVLWFKDGSNYGEFDIASDIELFEEVAEKDNAGQKTGKKIWKRVEETHKKVQTDAMTKGLSRLGFNADVFLKKFDDSRYVQNRRNEVEQEQRQQAPAPRQQYQAPAQQPAQAQQAPQSPLASEALKNEVTKAAQAAGFDNKTLAPILKNRGMTWKGLTTAQAEALIGHLKERAKELKENLARSAEYEASRGGAV